jgi:UDP-N-acetylglucosamine 2-epimerase (non-hydrolysing)
MKIVNVVGARPNFIKISPLIEEMAKYPALNTCLVHTGQHYDRTMDRVFFEDLTVPEPDVNLGVGSGSHAYQTAEIMKRIEPIFAQEKADLVLVVGDVNSTLAAALTAAQMHIPIAHIEAGLRSFDKRMPEEINRLLTDQISDFLFVTEQVGVRNLRKEGIPDSKIFLVGNVMIDVLVKNKPRIDKRKILEELGLEPRLYGLLTLHRPSNVDEKAVFGQILELLGEITGHLPVVFPVHPRSKKRLEEFGLLKELDKIERLQKCEPLGYLDFLKLVSEAKLVLTDSGGIQDETSFIGVPCLTLRSTTEHLASIQVGTNRLVGLERDKILQGVHKALSTPREKPPEIPLWDGHAAARILSTLSRHFSF